MTDVLVVTQHHAAYAALLEHLNLPGFQPRYAANADAAINHCREASVLFGAPDELAKLAPHCPQLKWIQSSWAGITPLLSLAPGDYIITGVKDIFGQAMSEYVLGWLLALERHIPQHFQAQHWDDTPDGSVANKRLGIMGTGSIGAAVAKNCGLMGMQVVGYSRSGAAIEGFDTVFGAEQMDRFFDGLDYLVCLLPHTDQTTGLVSAERLQKLNNGAVLINAGRANVLALDDVLEALASGHLSHAVLDVLAQEPLAKASPLWQVENLTITSHTAAPTPAAAIVDVFADNYRRYVAGDSLLYEVDLARGY